MGDELYRLPLAEFTVARDSLAARLRAAGDAKAAAETRRLRKPSIPAWAANQLVWQAPELWRRLQQATAALRQQHERPSTPAELRQAGHEQRLALQACEAKAAELLAKDGHAADAAVLGKVSSTLLALAHGSSAASPGRVDRELAAPGFETAQGLRLVERAPQTAAAVPAPGVKAEARAGKASAAAEQRARSRERQAALAGARARQAESRRRLMTARARLAADDERRHALERDLERARQAYDEARQQLEAAGREDAEAEAALRALLDGPDDH